MKLVLQEVLLPFLQQLTLGVRSAVAEKLFRIAVTWLGEKSSLLKIPGETHLLNVTVGNIHLSAGDMKVLSTHSSIALNAQSSPGELHIFAQRAMPFAPMLWKNMV